MEIDKSLQEKRISISHAKKGNWAKKAWKLVRVPIITAAILTSFAFGFIGFQKYAVMTNSGHNQFTIIYESLQLFKFSGGNLAAPIPWELEIARWSSPLLAGYAVVLSLAALFRNRLREMSVGFYKKHVVICGLGKKGVLLARNFHRSGYKVVVIEIDAANPNVATCREEGILIFIGNARDIPTLKRANIQNAESLICVAGDDVLNSDIALIAEKNLQPRKHGKLNCSIHVDDPTLWTLLRGEEFTSGRSQSFRLDFFNIYDEGAKQLLLEFPLVEKGIPQNSPHLVFVGFSNFSQQLLLNSARQWVSDPSQIDRKIKVSIVDLEAGTQEEKIKSQYSLVEKTTDIKSYQEIKEAGGINFKGSTNGGTLTGASRIYINFENENLVLSSALSLLNRIQKEETELIVTMNDETGLAALIKENTLSNDRLRRLHFFGLLERTCTPQLVFNSMNESIARAIHANYLEMMATSGKKNGNSASTVSWDELSDDLKEMNRDQADSIGLKMKLISCEIVPWTEFGAEKFTFTPDEIEKLAEMEHERWLRFKHQQGWRYGVVRDDKKKEHPSLVDWDDPSFPESEKEKDRSAVRQIPMLLASAGYQLYRLDKTTGSETLFINQEGKNGSRSIYQSLLQG